MNATVYLAQIVKKATCLMRTIQCNSNNCLTPEFKWTPFENRNNLVELITPIKAGERSITQISFSTQDPNIRQAQSGIRVKNYSRSTIHYVFKIRESARFSAQIHNPYAFYGQIRRSENLFTRLFKSWSVKTCQNNHRTSCDLHRTIKIKASSLYFYEHL